jgi:hypothetical protein
MEGSMAKCDPLFIRIFKHGGGTQSEFARRMSKDLGREIDHRLVSRWKYVNFIPEQYALSVERVTNGMVSIREILQLAERNRVRGG